MTTEEILDLLLVGKPVSIVRAGDGEKLLLESNKSIQAYQLCMQSVIKRQLGFEPVMTEVYEMRDHLIEAYSKADVIGIPMQKNLKSLNSSTRNIC